MTRRTDQSTPRSVPRTTIGRAPGPSRRPVPPRLLTLAGSDSGGGAGIQADLKTFAAHGGYGMSVITAVTAQNTRAVTAVHEIPPTVVAAQIDAVFEDLGVDAVKIGMLGSASIVRSVAARLREWAGRQPELPVVLDPVMVAKSGDPLLADEAVETLLRELVPLATVLTPNLPEASRLTGLPVGDEDERRAAARKLALVDGPIPGRPGPAVLIKGGHGSGETVVDLLLHRGNVHRFPHPRLDTTATHGTGCTLSSAIAAHLAWGEEIPEAVAGAIEYLTGAMEAAFPIGSGHGPVNHLYRLALVTTPEP
jgi:hydroxymethylpyrimidine/phosphomethylpyrimidine kinase